MIYTGLLSLLLTEYAANQKCSAVLLCSADSVQTYPLQCGVHCSAVADSVHHTCFHAPEPRAEAVQKRAIHITLTRNLTRGMPYSSMLLHVNLIPWLHVEKVSLGVISVILLILPRLFTASFLHPDPPLSPLGSDVLKSFLKSILVPSAIVLFIQYGLNHYQ